MPDLPPHVTTYKDRHGKTRYRFRRDGATVGLPGAPGETVFEAAYSDALAGRLTAKPRAKKRPAPAPRTLRAAWLMVQRTADWQQLRMSSRTQQIGVAERFLGMPIATNSTMTFGQMPFAGIRRGDVKNKILGRFADRPHAGEAVLRLLRKLSLIALDLEWIENDPTYRVRFRPKLIGHRAWTDTELAAYAERWPLGTKQRLGFALALYTGQRRADVPAMRWAAYDGAGIAVTQEKTGAPLWIPAHPDLKLILDAIERRGLSILTTERGKAFTTCGFGNMMADAIGAAGLPDACRLHGLRKSAGRCLAEAGATTRQIMAVLGHKTLSEAERYTREAEQRRLALQGIEHWAKPRLIVVGK